MPSNIPAQQHELLSFAGALSRYLSSASIWRMRPELWADSWIVDTPLCSLSFDADIAISNRIVRCGFCLYSRWDIMPPKVTCKARWMRPGVEWHLLTGSRLCWVYPPYWEAIFEKLMAEIDPDVARETAARWCFEHCADLIQKHLTADELGLTKWPKEWQFWGHGKAAEPEFAAMQRRGDIERIVSRLARANENFDRLRIAA